MKKIQLIPSFLALFIYWISIYTSSAAVFTVTTTNVTGVGSIDVAITAANGNGAGKDTILFNIPGAGPHTITVNITFQAITGDLLICGDSIQTGYDPLNPKPVVELFYTINSSLSVNSGAVEIRALAFNGNGSNAHGIILQSSGTKIKGCYFGLGLDGVTDRGNQFMGILINSSSNNIIGGALRKERNIISGNNQHGIQIVSGSNNYIIGNYIGTNAAGTAAVQNTFSGIIMEGTSNNNIIGGRSLDSSNTISGNGQNGLVILGGTGNKIIGNNIGLQTDRSSALGNTNIGIYINGCTSTQIGNVGSSAGNIISSNGSIGINIESCIGTIVKSNIIGTSANTQLPRGNHSNNIQLQGTNRQTVIGGDHATEGNIISASYYLIGGVASGGAGINLDPGSNKTIIKGNYIGTDNTGTMALGNYVIGIILKSDSCIVGGTVAGEGNIIADTKLLSGVLIANANHNSLIGNLVGIGLNATPLPNNNDGILIAVENAGNTASNNVINYNTVAYNKGNGIGVGRTFGPPYYINNNERQNDLRFNSIFCNQQLGIYLRLDNVADQGNNGKTAPAINNALSSSSKVVGLANGLLPTDLVDIYEMSECINCDQNPQGKRYVTTVSPDASGNWSFDNGSPITGTIIAMATDAQGNSSQFSLCFTPCSAKAIASPTEYSKMLESNSPLPITFTSSSEFSPLTPIAGKVYWTIGTTDTSGAALLSKASSFTLTFAPGGNGAAYGPGVYEIFLTAVQSGCVDITKVKLNIFYIPNMITPNGDQKNDNWEVASSPGQFDARIYNRWGDLVYSKSDYTNEWNGAGLNDGVYYYLLEDKVQSGKSYKGWVQVIR